MTATAPAMSGHGTLVVGDPLVLRPLRLTDRLLARVFAASLDRKLAAASPPEAGPLLAARAQDIVSIRSRRALASHWDHLLWLARTSQTGTPRIRSISIRAGQIAAAKPAIRELTRRLSTPLPVTAQGVAMASVLLTDAAGPVYNRHSDVTLSAALEEAITHLDPALPLTRAARPGEPGPHAFGTV